LGNCQVGCHAWKNAFGKVPKTKEIYIQDELKEIYIQDELKEIYIQDELKEIYVQS